MAAKLATLVEIFPKHAKLKSGQSCRSVLTKKKDILIIMKAITPDEPITT
jgi:hypothetical protein